MKVNRLTAALLAVFLLLTPCAALGPAESAVYAGMDVSVYQGDIDFRRAADSGVQVVYIRAGYGTTADENFARNCQAARAAGLHYGFYLYVTARTAEQAREQARFFSGLIEGTGYDCRPAMDFESFSGLSRAEVNVIGLAFLQELEALTGQTPLLYTDAYAADAVWQSDMGRYPLWAADYGPEEPDITSDIWAGWTGFQYSDAGRIPGIEGNVDLDHFTRGVFSDSSTAPDDACVRYTVRPGDTLWTIAQRYGTTVATLASLNQIQHPDLIFPGQTLRIPIQSAAAQYTVQPGDTLWAIARQYHTSVETLVQLNRISNPDLIYPGQVLTLSAA